MMMDLEKFFEEKEIAYQSWEIEHNGQTHFIDSDSVIEAILISKGAERTQICGMLFKLDFHNSKIEPFLRHLAECMIKQQFGE